jgi:hypothetical protein
VRPGSPALGRFAGQFLRESQGATQSALSSLLPAVLGGIAQKGAAPQSATGLMSLINGANLDGASLGNIAGLFGGGGSGVNALLKASTSSLVLGLFGDRPAHPSTHCPRPAASRPRQRPTFS